MLREMIDERVLVRRFSEMGARLRVRESAVRELVSGGAAVDVRKDGEGEYFELILEPKRPLDVLAIDVRPEQRHLLLMVRDLAVVGPEGKHKFLCGHDERAWFVAAVPERARAKDVPAAMEALKPRLVLARQKLAGVRQRDRNRRRNEAFVRQGEWFFVPVRHLVVDPQLVLAHEPLRRGNGSKAHRVEQLYRTGGQRFYVCRRYPNGVTEQRYKRLLESTVGARGWDWQEMRADMDVYVRGRVSHADHATIVLDGWHRVLMNTEREADAARQVRFLD